MVLGQGSKSKMLHLLIWDHIDRGSCFKCVLNLKHSISEKILTDLHILKLGRVWLIKPVYVETNESMTVNQIPPEKSLLSDWPVTVAVSGVLQARWKLYNERKRKSNNIFPEMYLQFLSLVILYTPYDTLSFLNTDCIHNTFIAIFIFCWSYVFWDQAM